MIGYSDEVLAVDAAQDCGRGHACSFCPLEETCDLDQGQHSQVHLQQRLSRINWFIPVMANKGGVGKSTVAANLALALARQGYSVGLADADVHGPNAPRLFGLQQESVKVDVRGVHAPQVPVLGRGALRVGSLGYFLEEQNTPVVWRDAYKHDYVHHMLGSFDWGVIDFLVIDMPPGTGNELITLADALNGCNTAALLVSSADAIALQDSLKAARYCGDTAMPVLGLVENYAGTVCPHCGSEFEMFPRAPEVEEFERQGIATLARIPFTPQVGAAAAAGAPIAGEDESPLAQTFADLADTCSRELIARQRTMQS